MTCLVRLWVVPLLLAATSFATSLPNGSSFAPPEVMADVDPSVGGLIIYEGVHAIDTATFVGVFRDRVVISKTTGDLIFYDTVYNGRDVNDDAIPGAPTAVVTSFRHTDFAAFSLDVGYRPDGLGSIEPTLVARDLSGSTVTWSYTGIPVGADSYFVYAKTTTPYFSLKGTATINWFDAAGGYQSIALTGIAQPSVTAPEPASLLLFASGVGLLCFRLRR